MILYISHTCKNKDCQAAFIDRDVTNIKLHSPNWKYCPDCVAKGYPDIKNPPLSEAPKNTLAKLHKNSKLKAG